MTDDIDTRLDATRDKLETFGEETRAYLDALENEVATRLGAIQNALPSEASGGTSFSAQSLGNAGTDGGDWSDGLGRALEHGLAGSLSSLLHGHTDPRSLLRAPANAFGQLIGHEIAGAFGLGGGDGGMRLSDAQSSLEGSAPLRRAQRNL